MENKRSKEIILHRLNNLRRFRIKNLCNLYDLCKPLLFPNGFYPVLTKRDVLLCLRKRSRMAFCEKSGLVSDIIRIPVYKKDVLCVGTGETRGIKS